MTCDYLALATAGVQGLHPYQPGKPLEELEREYGIRDAVKLASNENPLGPSPLVLDALRGLAAAEGVARYPDGSGYRLKQALSLHLGIIAPEQLTLGNGSNDVLELIVRAFATPTKAVMFSEHAFAVYPLAAQAVGAQAQMVAAKNWGHDLDAMLAAITQDTRIIFIANPNNPTGTWNDRDSLQHFLEKVPSNIIVVIDEAYFEYVDEANYPDSLQWLEDIPNLIVTRTFSKAYGLAGLRVGYAISSPQIADILNRVRQPFNVNSFALLAAEKALEDQEHLADAVELNRAGMAQYQAAFSEMGLDYIPSIGNFICVDLQRHGTDMYEALLREGVIVRPVANYGLPTHLRISIGAEKENQRCIKALQGIL